jgi:putative transposase
MARKGRSSQEIFHGLHQVEGGEKVTEVCRRLGVSEQTFDRWKKQFSGLGPQELRELRSLRHEDAKLKQVVADLTLDRHILQKLVRKKLGRLERAAHWRLGRRRPTV